MQKNDKQRNIRRAILQWYKRQGRTLPWRNITSPYRILLSEIMLQQTQVSRVLVKYPEFVHRFPTLHSLARARQRDVVLAWQGMGYNNRAVRLHAFARAIVEKHRGRIPNDFETLIALPGIGRYTANALLSSAFGEQLPIVDVNVQRVLSRIFWRMNSTAAMRSTTEIWMRAEQILPKGNAYNWNQALMDLGASVCTARVPRCEDCPVARFCSSRVGMKQAGVSRPKSEPSRDGIPNRMFRGRIIERLRQLSETESVRADFLGKAIHPGFSKEHEPWFRKLLSDLQDDGLIRIRGNNSLTTTRVVLV